MEPPRPQRPPGDLGLALRTARLALGLSQREVARLVGCSNVHLSLLESGQRVPSTLVARRLCTALYLSGRDAERLVQVSNPHAGYSRPPRRYRDAGPWPDGDDDLDWLDLPPVPRREPPSWLSVYGTVRCQGCGQVYRQEHPSCPGCGAPRP